MDQIAGLNETTALAAGAASSAFLTIFTTTIIFVPKNALAVRLGATAAMGVLLRIWCNTLFEITPRPAYRSNFGVSACVAFLSGAEELLLSRIDATDLSDGRGHPQVGTATLLWRALCVFFNLRRIGTRWEIRGVKRRGPQSRMRFLMMTLAKIAVAYLILDVIDSAPLPEPQFFVEEKQTLFRFGGLSTEDVGFRLFGSIGLWVSSYLCNMLNSNFSAFMTVLLGVSKPGAWPRLNGPLSSVYTVRGFWGTFWHQCCRKTLTSWADFTSDKVLRLPRGTLASRYTRIFLTFFLSGVMHHCMDRAFGTPHRELASVTFFSLQALGVMVEDGVQAATADLPIPAPVRRLVGYVWVVAFLWWSTPQWLYPSMRMGDAGNAVPFSFVRMLMGGPGLTA